MQSTRRKYLFLSHAGALVLGVGLLLGLNACIPQVTETRVPQRWDVIQLSDYRDRIVTPGEMAVASNGYVYVVDHMGAIEVFDGMSWVATIPWPDHQFAERLSARIVAHPENGYVYLSDGGYDTVHVIRDTELITSLHIGGRRTQYLAIDTRSGYLYAVGTKDMIVPENFPVNTLGIIDGARVISRTEWQRVETGSIAYNPVTEHVYLGQIHRNSSYRHTMNILLQIETGHPVTSTALPDEEYGGIHNIAVNDKTGEMYMLQDNRGLLYWNGAAYVRFLLPQHESEKAYALKDIAIDTRRGLAYVTSEDGWGSHVFVLQGDQVVAELPLNANFNRSVTVDEKHDYVYVTNYRSGGLTVLRGTEVITTLATGGAGPRDVLIDERTDLIYVTNASSGSVAIFGFGDPPDPQAGFMEQIWAWVRP